MTTREPGAAARGAADVARPSVVSAALRSLDVTPNRRLGQNFLVDRHILAILVRAAGTVPGDGVLEIGPGLGVLTGALLDQGCRVVAVEKDRRLCGYLAGTLGGNPALELIHGDALELDGDWCAARGIEKVAAALPFSVGTRILMNLVMSDRCPRRLAVMVQREVGERLVAAPGGGAYGLSTVWAGARYGVDLVKSVSPSCFLPRPEVSAAVMRLARLETVTLSGPELARFRRLTRHAFQHRRKQVASILPAAPADLRCGRARAARLLADLGADVRCRPGDLAPEVWVRMAERLPAATGTGPGADLPC